MRVKALFFTFFLTLCCLPLIAEEALEETPKEAAFQERYNAALDVTEITLKNGMKVILKPTSFEKNEVFIQFLAPGGYATLDKQSRASARIAAKAAVESGLGGYTSDQLSSLQYRESVEVKPQIDRFYRTINGSCRPESIKTALSIVKMVFENHKVNKDALKRVIERERKNFENTHIGERPTLSELYYLINTQNSRGFRPIVGSDLNHVNFSHVEAIYKHSFSQPSEFIGTIVGNFNLKETKLLLVEILGKLEGHEKFDWAGAVKRPHFPTGINRREVAVGHRFEDEVATWMTIPINHELDQCTFFKLQLAVRLLEMRLQEVVASLACETHTVDVFYDLPMFPYLSPVWINIRFRCPKQTVATLEKAIIKEIGLLQTEGPKGSEVEMVKKLMKEANSLWQHYNSFWHANLINCYVWGWDPQKLCQQDLESAEFSNINFTDMYKNYFPIDNYTVINAYSK